MLYTYLYNVCSRGCKEIMVNHSHVSDSLLHKHGYRLTPQRYLVLSVIEEANCHISLEQIAERVQERNPRVSLSTIYRTLELLKELELVLENHLPGEAPHYELLQSKTHHHLVCKACHHVTHLDETLLGDLHERLQTQYQYRGLVLALQASGYCDACWRKMQHDD